jgi:hypothetical protein
VAPGALLTGVGCGGVPGPMPGVAVGCGMSGATVPAGRFVRVVALLGAGPAATGPPGALVTDAWDRPRLIKPGRTHARLLDEIKAARDRTGLVD